jgi:hypothetical protein
MPTTVPRTQTGLVPTTYQNKLNRICSPENWRRLPPRPAPEQYQFRGCNKKEAVSSSAPSKNGIQKRLQNVTACKSREEEGYGKRTKQSAYKNLLPWDDCMRDVTVSPTLDLDKKSRHRLNEETTRNNKDLTSLEYIRNSGRKRRQLRDLQKRLDDEIEEENRLYGLDEKYNAGRINREQNENEESNGSEATHLRHQRVTKGGQKHLIDEMNRIKTSLLNRLELECSSNSNAGSEDDDGSITISSDQDRKSCSDQDRERRNYTKQYIIQYSLGDASTLNSLQSANSSLTIPSSHENIQLSLPTRNHQKSTITCDEVAYGFLREKNLSDKQSIVPQDELSSPSLAEDMSPQGRTDRSFSTTSTWDDLSHNQHERIKLRAEQLYHSKYKPRLPLNHGNTSSKLVLQPSEPIVYKQASTMSNSSKENDCFCVKNLVAAITKGLCSQPGLIDKSGVLDARENEESTISVEDIHDDHQFGGKASTKVMEAMPLPRHPYELPLENQFRKVMKSSD